MIAACELPQEILVANCPVFEKDVEFTVVPNPSCPFELLPVAHTDPSDFNNMLKVVPIETATACWFVLTNDVKFAPLTPN